MKNGRNILLVIIISLLGIIPLDSNASPVVGVDDMFARFSSSSIALTELVKYAAYIIGIYLVVGSVFKFSKLGNNGGYSRITPRVPLTMFFVGVSLFALTSSVDVVKNTMLMGSGPGSILMPSASGSGVASAALQGVLLFIRLVGYIAFVRGWLLLNQAGLGRDGVIGRGLTHLGGGVAAINIETTAKILANTFGIGNIF